MRLFPYATSHDPWLAVYVPDPPKKASITQLTAHAALAGLVGANTAQGPLYGNLDATIRRFARAYMEKYHAEEWEEPKK